MAFLKALWHFFFPSYQTEIQYVPLTPKIMLPEAPTSPAAPSVDIPEPLPWDTAQKAYHGVRVLCDLAGLTVDEKNLICACIFQESRFLNTAENHNRDSQGNILSTDFGFCQVNDFYHIGQNKDFPNVQFVLENPDKVVSWMITMYKHGLLKQWVSYSSGAYKVWLSPTSPMWDLKTPN